MKSLFYELHSFVVESIASSSVRWKFARYIFSGGFATLATIGTLYIVTDIFGVWYLYGTSVAFVVGVTVSFIMQKFFTFQNRATHPSHLRSQVLLFVAIALVNLSLNAVLVLLMVEYVKLWHIVAQIISSAVIALLSFFVYTFVFKVKE